MAGEPGSRGDRAMMWIMFVVPSTAGTLLWIMRDRVEGGMGELVAWSGWGCGGIAALLILFDYYGRPPSQR